VGSERHDRIAFNEALFREANERAAAWEERREEPGEPQLYHCECADLECREKVSLDLADYERVRSDSMLFFIVPGHQIEDAETVLEEHEGWAVIRKNASVEPIVRATDPRGH
jgi:hypothetical protein